MTDCKEIDQSVRFPWCDIFGVCNDLNVSPPYKMFFYIDPALYRVCDV